jgi:hypothetical protein
MLNGGLELVMNVNENFEALQACLTKEVTKVYSFR